MRISHYVLRALSSNYVTLINITCYVTHFFSKGNTHISRKSLRKIFRMRALLAQVRPLPSFRGRCNDKDMVRGKKQLEESRQALQMVIQRLRKEIELIDSDIASYGAGLRLDDSFFWSVLAPMLESDGLTTTEMLRRLSKRGYDPRPGNFRTFISRYGQRGYLESSGTGRALLWRLTPASIVELAKLKA